MSNPSERSPVTRAQDYLMQVRNNLNERPDSSNKNYYQGAKGCGSEIEMAFKYCGRYRDLVPIRTIHGPKTYDVPCEDIVVENDYPYIKKFLAIEPPGESVGVNVVVKHFNTHRLFGFLTKIFSITLRKGDYGIGVLYDSRFSKPTLEYPYLDPLFINTFAGGRSHTEIPYDISLALSPFRAIEKNTPEYTASSIKLDIARQIIKTAQELMFINNKQRAEQCGKEMETIFNSLNEMGIKPTIPPLTDISKTFTVPCTDPVVEENNPLNAFLRLGPPEVNIAVTDWNNTRTHGGPGVKIWSVDFTKIINGERITVKGMYDSRASKLTSKFPWLDPLKVMTYSPYDHLSIPKDISFALEPFSGMQDEVETTELRIKKLQAAEVLIGTAKKLLGPKMAQVPLTQ